MACKTGNMQWDWAWFNQMQHNMERNLGDLPPLSQRGGASRLARLFEELQRCGRMCQTLVEKNDVLLQSESYRTMCGAEQFKQCI